MEVDVHGKAFLRVDEYPRGQLSAKLLNEFFEQEVHGYPDLE